MVGSEERRIMTRTSMPRRAGIPYELYLAERYLRFHRGRSFLSFITLISVVGVAVGTAALVIALALNAGFVNDIRDRIHSGSAHLTVISTEEELFEQGDRLVARAQQVAGVEAAAPVLHTPGMLTSEGFGSPAYAEILGIEPAAHARVILDPEETEEPFSVLERETISGRQGILLGVNLASKLGVIEGDSVRLLVPKLTLSPWAPIPRSKVFEVVGTYRSDHFMEDSQRAYVSLAAAQGLLKAEGRMSWVEVRIDDLRRLSVMKQSLRQALGAPWLVVDLIEQNQELLKALNTEKLALFLAIGLIVVVAALNIVSTLVLMVADKIKEIGTLSAMGARPAGIATVFVLQGFVIGIVGTGLGITLGTAISIWLDRYRIIQLDPDVYYLTYLPFVPQPLDLFFVGAAAVVISLAATVYPAMRAARLDPVEAIRHE